MDWTETSKKVTRNQQLSTVAVTRAVPNAVLSSSNSPSASDFRASALATVLFLLACGDLRQGIKDAVQPSATPARVLRPEEPFRSSVLRQRGLLKP
jgi:hypothetical protein